MQRKKSHVTKFGPNLRFLRKLRGLSQTELGAQVDLSRNNIASYESSAVEPNTTNFLKICLFFEVAPKDCLTKLFSEFPDLLSKADGVQASTKTKHVSQHLNDFKDQTIKMAKILDGYRAFYEMQKMSISSPQEGELYSTMDNILELLSSLVETNSQLLEGIYPTSQLEADRRAV